jgi:HK97 family phage major capsid protein
MMKLSDLKSERAQLTAAANQLIGKTDATAEDFTAAEGMLAKIEVLKGQISTLEKLQAEAASAVVAAQTAPVSSVHHAVARDHKAEKEHNKSIFAGMVGSLVKFPGNPYAAAEYAKKNLGAIGNEVSMSLNSSSSTGGAILVPANTASSVIERLTPNAVVRSMGALTLPLNNGNLKLPSISGGASAGYIGREADATVSQNTFGGVQLTAKKLAALVPISNDLIRFAGTDQRVDSLIVEDTAVSMATAEDQAFIRGDGTNNTPTGLRTWLPAANLITATNVSLLTGAALIQAITADAGKAILALRRANVKLTNAGWLMHPDTFQFLSDLITTTGVKVFPELSDGKFRGFPIGVTTQIPTNLTLSGSGAAGNGSELYFVDFAQMVIGESMSMQVAVSTEATYTVGGISVNAFQRDETLIRVITENDFGPRHAEAIAVLNGITWYR